MAPTYEGDSMRTGAPGAASALNAVLIADCEPGQIRTSCGETEGPACLREPRPQVFDAFEGHAAPDSRKSRRPDHRAGDQVACLKILGRITAREIDRPGHRLGQETRDCLGRDPRRSKRQTLPSKIRLGLRHFRAPGPGHEGSLAGPRVENTFGGETRHGAPHRHRAHAMLGHQAADRGQLGSGTEALHFPPQGLPDHRYAVTLIHERRR